MAAAFRTHVEFRSDAFPSRPGEAEPINSRQWGAALVDYLKPDLTAHGLKPGSLFTEDREYVIELENPVFGCG